MIKAPLGHRIMNESSVTADAYSNSIYPGGKGFHLGYDYNATGNLVGTLYLQCRNHPDDSWHTVNDASFPSSPAGVAGNDEVGFVDAFAYEYRVFCDFTSGDGELNIYYKREEIR